MELGLGMECTFVAFIDGTKPPIPASPSYSLDWGDLQDIPPISTVPFFNILPAPPQNFNSKSTSGVGKFFLRPFHQAGLISTKQSFLRTHYCLRKVRVSFSLPNTPSCLSPGPRVWHPWLPKISTPHPHTTTMSRALCSLHQLAG